MTRQPSRTQLNRLSRVLGAYGADARRWPAGDREALEGLLADLPAGIAGVRAEAEAIDRVLGQAASPAVPAGGIERALRRVQRARARDGEIAPPAMPAAAASRSPLWLSHGTAWSGIVLAASLVAGIYLGLSGSIAAYLPVGTDDGAVRTAGLADQDYLEDPYELLEFDNR